MQLVKGTPLMFGWLATNLMIWTVSTPIAVTLFTHITGLYPAYPLTPVIYLESWLEMVVLVIAWIAMGLGQIAMLNNWTWADGAKGNGVWVGA